MNMSERGIRQVAELKGQVAELKGLIAELRVQVAELKGLVAREQRQVGALRRPRSSRLSSKDAVLKVINDFGANGIRPIDIVNQLISSGYKVNESFVNESFRNSGIYTVCLGLRRGRKVEREEREGTSVYFPVTGSGKE